MAESDIERAVREGLQGSDPGEALARLVASGVEIRTTGDAAAVARFARKRHEALLDLERGHPWPLLSVVAALFRDVETREAFEVLRDDGLPALREAFDGLLGREWGERAADGLLSVVQVLALYRQEEDVARVARAVRDPSLVESEIWSGIFHAFDEGHPLRRVVLEALREPLPEGFACVAYLDFANELAREGSIPHPFDTPGGTWRLEGYLTDSDPERLSHAHSAAAALPFVSEPARGRLLRLGFDHPSQRVQLQAGWALAKVGKRAGVDFLARFCLDQRYSALAVEYLKELGELNAIPARAMNPDFAAVAEMCRWLAHPMEFGRPPDEAEVYDTRTLLWPPANESRRLHLVKFRYRGAKLDGGDEVGVGLVGSVTFALFGETTTEMPPEDVYALHCCWELEAEGDPRPPARRSVEAGRELLRKAGNGGF